MASITYIGRWKKHLQNTEPKNILSKREIVEDTSNEIDVLLNRKKKNDEVLASEGLKLKEKLLGSRRVMRRAFSVSGPTSLNAERHESMIANESRCLTKSLSPIENKNGDDASINEGSNITASLSKTKKQVNRKSLHRRTVSNSGSQNNNTKRRSSLPCRKSSIEIDYSGEHNRFQGFEKLDEATRRQLEIDIIEPLNFDYLKYRIEVLNCW